MPPRVKAVRSVSGILLYILCPEEVLESVPDAVSNYLCHLPSFLAPCRATASRHNMISSWARRRNTSLGQGSPMAEAITHPGVVTVHQQSVGCPPSHRHHCSLALGGTTHDPPMLDWGQKKCQAHLFPRASTWCHHFLNTDRSGTLGWSPSLVPIRPFPQVRTALRKCCFSMIKWGIFVTGGWYTPGCGKDKDPPR